MAQQAKALDKLTQEELIALVKERDGDIEAAGKLLDEGDKSLTTATARIAELEALVKERDGDIEAAGPSFVLPALTVTQYPNNPDLKHHESGWSRVDNGVGRWAYAERHALQLDDTYYPQQLFLRASKVVERAFDYTGTNAFGANKLGPIDKSGLPDCTFLPPFNRNNKLCVAIWIEPAPPKE